jgi:FSR family fosmidomycin resistance protein-like MFS transporter
MTLQWLQLFILAAIHVSVDMFGGILPAVLPAVREEFGLSLQNGIVLIAILNLTCNAMQIATGHLRPERTRPFFLLAGVWLASAMALFRFVPAEASPMVWLTVMVLVAGCGIAVVHPEALRGVHALERIPSSIGSSVFMTAGFTGFASGAWVGAALYSRWGWNGLLAMLCLPLAGSVLLLAGRIRLAVEPARLNRAGKVPDDRMRFWPLLVVTVPLATGSTILPGLLPTCLYEHGFELSFGGLSSMSFGVGGAAGALVWSVIAHRRGESRCIACSLLLGTPLVLGYLLALQHKAALSLLVAGGFCIGAAYPLLVSLARHARGPGLGMRMAVMVGGTWGAAGLIFLALGPVAEKAGVRPVLHTVWICYLTAGVASLILLPQRGPADRRTVSSPETL